MFLLWHKKGTPVIAIRVRRGRGAAPLIATQSFIVRLVRQRTDERQVLADTTYQKHGERIYVPRAFGASSRTCKE